MPPLASSSSSAQVCAVFLGKTTTLVLLAACDEVQATGRGTSAVPEVVQIARKHLMFPSLSLCRSSRMVLLALRAAVLFLPPTEENACVPGIKVELPAAAKCRMFQIARARKIDQRDGVPSESSRRWG